MPGHTASEEWDLWECPEEEENKSDKIEYLDPEAKEGWLECEEKIAKIQRDIEELDEKFEEILRTPQDTARVRSIAKEGPGSDPRAQERLSQIATDAGFSPHLTGIVLKRLNAKQTQVDRSQEDLAHMFRLLGQNWQERLKKEAEIDELESQKLEIENNSLCRHFTRLWDEILEADSENVEDKARVLVTEAGKAADVGFYLPNMVERVFPVILNDIKNLPKDQYRNTQNALYTHEQEYLELFYPEARTQGAYMKAFGLTRTEIAHRREMNWREAHAHIEKLGHKRQEPITIEDLVLIHKISSRGILPTHVPSIRGNGSEAHFYHVQAPSGGAELKRSLNLILNRVNTTIRRNPIRHTFNMEMAEAYVDYIHLHPHEDGNGTMAVFLLELAKVKAGYRQNTNYTRPGIRFHSWKLDGYERRVCIALGWDLFALRRARERLGELAIYPTLQK